MRHTKTSVTLALALAVLVAPALSGCINPVESIVEGAVEQASGGDVDLNSDGGLPDGFPTDVPLYDGEIVGGMGVGNVDDGGGWTVIIKVADVEADFKAINDQLVAAGFESSFSGFADGAGTGAYSNADYSVLLTVSDDGSGQKTATYIVGGTTSPE